MPILGGTRMEILLDECVPWPMHKTLANPCSKPCRFG
jgi:hypothetical protein